LRILEIPRTDKPRLVVSGVPDDRIVIDSMLVQFAQKVPGDITELAFRRLVEYETLVHASRGTYLRDVHPDDRPQPRHYTSAWITALGANR
jgi:hypothetical protein